MAIERLPAMTTTVLAFGLLTMLVSGCGAGSSGITYDGGELFANNCANCHGNFGEGDGAVTPDLAVVLQDLRYLSERNDGTFPSELVRGIIDGRDRRQVHGPVGMPVWGAVFQTQEGYDKAAEDRVAGKIEALVQFLESIQISVQMEDEPTDP